MKKLLGVLGISLALSACSDVPAGNIGIKVYMLGAKKGVDHEVLGVGRYYIGMNEQLFLFPTSEQMYNWTKSPNEGKAVDESITFSTRETLEVNADVGISYHIDPEKISVIFQKYRKGIEDITHIYLRNYVRDAFTTIASKMTVEEVNGEGKARLVSEVTQALSEQLKPEGIVLDKVSLLGKFRLPEGVEAAINSKIEATQRAQQRQNEVAEAKAQGEKEVATAHAAALATLEKAHAEAEANRLKQSSLTQALIQYEAIQKWDGALPTYQGGSAMPFVNIGK
jgi:regulator of protease activity HflC (stomatin/prohibitin superfamily)